MSPGPLLALVISQTLRHGAREGIKVAFAPLLSDIPIVLLCLFALSRVSSLGSTLAWVSVAGAVFVAYLGYESFRAPGIEVKGYPAAPRSLAKAVAVNLLNPHVYLFWAAVGAPLILKGLGRTDGAAFTFIGGFYVSLVGSKVLLAMLLSRSRNALAGRSYAVTVRLVGAALFAMAAWMLWNGVRDLTA
ncbi:MAG: LysE family transporter [Bryobacteraceae bacterium]|nr:LysE family transporter [Bryobacteraceae bacterium]